MWGRKSIVKESIFFKGINIFDTLKNSLFGRVKEIINKLVENNPKELEEYKLPKVIVIGNESTGKSSLLENITKCQIFPRHHAFCTKAPIRLILNNGPPKYSIRHESGQSYKVEILDKKDIYKKVQEILDKLPNNAISEDEIIVEMTDHDLPSFEFYDLPGIRSYPPSMAETTTNLCRKYLAAKDSIVLCVVPATVTRLTSCQSIALINEMGITQNCILALTMCDRLQLENVEDLLIKRILLASDELTSLNFKNCVGIVNRLHTDCCSLEENDHIEMQWFKDNIIDCMPTDYKDVEEKIVNNITTQQLLRQMDILYNNFIQENWKPKIISKINSDLANINKQISNLGYEQYTEQAINTYINNYLLIEIPKHLNDRIIPKETKSTDSAMAQLQWHRNAILLMDAVFRTFSNMHLEKDNIIQIIDMFFSAETIFEESLRYKLYRFESKYCDVQNNIEKYYRSIYPEIIKQTKIAMIQDINNKYMNCFNLEQNEEYYKNKASEMIQLTIYHDFMNDMIKTQEWNYKHKESEQYSKKRQELTQKLQVLQNYSNSVNNI